MSRVVGRVWVLAFRVESLPGSGATRDSLGLCDVPAIIRLCNNIIVGCASIIIASAILLPPSSSLLALIRLLPYLALI